MNRTPGTDNPQKTISLPTLQAVVVEGGGGSGSVWVWVRERWLGVRGVVVVEERVTGTHVPVTVEGGKGGVVRIGSQEHTFQ